MSRDFSFRGTWRLAAPRAQVREVLVDLEHYSEWWPQVVAVAKIDDDHARVLCRSTLPYTLDLMLTAVRREPDLLETDLAGDLTGVVRWRLSDEDGGTRLDFEQDVLLGKRGLRHLTGVLRPLLTWNHEVMMTGCIDGLRARVGLRGPRT